MKKETKEKEIRLCFPWEPKSFDGDEVEFKYCINTLKHLGFDIDNLIKFSNNENLISISSEIVKVFLSRTPFIVVGTNDLVFLDKLEKIVPVIYSLTTRLQSKIIKNADIIKASQEILRPYHDEDSTKFFSTIRKISLLIWSRVDQQYGDITSKFEALLCGLIDFRPQYNKHVLFTMLGDKNYLKNEDDMLKVISDSTLKSISSILDIEDRTSYFFYDRRLEKRRKGIIMRGLK